MEINAFKPLSLLVVSVIDGLAIYLICSNQILGWILALAGLLLTIFWILVWRDVERNERDTFH